MPEVNPTRHPSSRSGHARRTAKLLALALLPAGCNLPQVVEGTLPDADNVAQVQVGKSTKADVTRLMGSPGATSTVDQNVWFYPSRRVGRNTFGDSTLIEQRVYEVDFNGQGVVTDLQTNLNDAHTVEMIPRITPAPGKELSFVEQLLGNFGLGNNSSKKKKKDDDDQGG